jgi:hypothetical protein
MLKLSKSAEATPTRSYVTDAPTAVAEALTVMTEIPIKVNQSYAAPAELTDN